VLSAQNIRPAAFAATEGDRRWFATVFSFQCSVFSVQFSVKADGMTPPVATEN
jgi:hypothetical protein